VGVFCRLIDVSPRLQNGVVREVCVQILIARAEQALLRHLGERDDVRIIGLQASGLFPVPGSLDNLNLHVTPGSCQDGGSLQFEEQPAGS
jgi:hypothetical protein